MDTILKIDDLWVEFPSRESAKGIKQAVKGLSLNVAPGEVFGFLGPNGAGKTSTMNVLLGFVPPTRGNAYLFGSSVRETFSRQRIGYLPELTYYYKFLSAEELLRFYAKIFGIPRAEADRACRRDPRQSRDPRHGPAEIGRASCRERVCLAV